MLDYDFYQDDISINDETTEQLIRRERTRQLCQDDLFIFARYMFKYNQGQKFISNWHHKEICDILTKVFDGEINRLIINIPPRYSKTELIKQFVAWSLGHCPDSEFILSSYSKDLCTSNTYQIRQAVESETYSNIFDDVVLESDSNRKDQWRTNTGGIVYAAGTYGTITGFGAGKMRDGFGGAIIIDDPHKPNEVESDVKRKAVLEWYNNTLKSRTNSKETPIIVIMQRLHLFDLSGFLLDGGSGEEWHHLKIPVISEDGQPLWEYKHNLEDIEKEKITSPTTFAGQYMQEPCAKGGNIYKDEYWKYYDILPQIEYSIIVADTAMKTKEQNDYSVIQLWCKGMDKNLYLHDQIRGKWEAPELETRFVSFWNKHKANPQLKLRKSYVEDKVSGTGLIQKVKKEHKIPIEGIKRNVDKITRASEVIGYISSGYVYLNKNAFWLSDYLAETSIFPNGNHDDQVDVTNDGINILTKAKKDPKITVLNF